MVHTATSTSFFHNFFAPLPENTAEKSKGALDHVSEYVESTEGAWDTFRLGNHFFSFFEQGLDPSHRFVELFGKMKDLFDSAGAALSIPVFISCANSLRRSTIQLFHVHDLPYNDPARDQKLAQATKKSFVDSMSLTFIVAQGALFFEGVKILLLTAAQLSFVNVVYNVSGAAGDTVELGEQYYKLQHYNSPEAQPQNQIEATKLEEKKTLAWLTIAKDVASIALSVIALNPLMAELIGFSFIYMPAFAPATVLAISAFWLAMKISSYFYKVAVVEAPPVATV